MVYYGTTDLLLAAGLVGRDPVFLAMPLDKAIVQLARQLRLHSS